MKGKAGRKKRVAAIAATILAFTGVATANPYLVYGQNNDYRNFEKFFRCSKSGKSLEYED